MRTALLAAELAKRGHGVLWWAGCFDHLTKQWATTQERLLEMDGGVGIQCLKGYSYDRNISVRRFAAYRKMARRFRRLARAETPPDIIVASVPSHDLAHEATQYAQEFRVPILVDIRDPWPDLFLNHVPELLRPLARRVLYREFELMTRVCVRADGIIGATNTFLAHGLRYAGREQRPGDRVFYLGQAPRKPAPPSSSERTADLRLRCAGKFVVAFVGTFGAYHSPTVMIDAAAMLVDAPIAFVLAGNGRLPRESLKKAATCTNLMLPGWLNSDEIGDLMSFSNVGVCPTTTRADLFPNKAFTYFAAGLPVLSAFDGDLKQWIEERSLGFHFAPGDARGFASILRQLASQPDVWRVLQANVVKTFGSYFSSDRIYSDYALHVESVGANPPNRCL